jgi:transcription antitermination factor NusG
MPILPPEPALVPANLFQGVGATVLDGRLWWVMHTRPRQEKSLARWLRETGIPFFLPLVPMRRPMRGRVMTSHVPLFAGYVFVLGSRDERQRVLTTSRVVRVLEVPDQERLWSDLRQVHQLLTSRLPITPEDRLAPGMEVEIRGGPLAGLRGNIVRTASGRRFVVEVDFIHRGASVLLDDFNLQQADVRRLR